MDLQYNQGPNRSLSQGPNPFVQSQVPPQMAALGNVLGPGNMQAQGPAPMPPPQPPPPPPGGGGDGQVPMPLDRQMGPGGPGGFVPQPSPGMAGGLGMGMQGPTPGAPALPPSSPGQDALSAAYQQHLGRSMPPGELDRHLGPNPGWADIQHAITQIAASPEAKLRQMAMKVQKAQGQPQPPQGMMMGNGQPNAAFTGPGMPGLPQTQPGNPQQQLPPAQAAGLMGALR